MAYVVIEQLCCVDGALNSLETVSFQDEFRNETSEIAKSIIKNLQAVWNPNIIFCKKTKAPSLTFSLSFYLSDCADSSVLPGKWEVKASGQNRIEWRCVGCNCWHVFH